MADVNLIEHGDWQRMASYFGKMFPTANKAWIEQMCRRMCRTLGYQGSTREMNGIEYCARLEQLLDSINNLPPDINNKLMQ